MLSIFFGDMPEAIYNTNVYFQNQYRDDWLTKPLSKEIIQDVDKSEVVSANLIPAGGRTDRSRRVPRPASRPGSGRCSRPASRPAT